MLGYRTITRKGKRQIIVIMTSLTFLPLSLARSSSFVDSKLRLYNQYPAPSFVCRWESDTSLIGSTVVHLLTLSNPDLQSEESIMTGVGRCVHTFIYLRKTLSRISVSHWNVSRTFVHRLKEQLEFSLITFSRISRRRTVLLRLLLLSMIIERSDFLTHSKYTSKQWLFRSLLFHTLCSPLN